MYTHKGPAFPQKEPCISAKEPCISAAGYMYAHTQKQIYIYIYAYIHMYMYTHILKNIYVKNFVKKTAKSKSKLADGGFARATNP